MSTTAQPALSGVPPRTTDGECPRVGEGGRQEEHREPLLIWGRTECGDRQPILPHLFNEYTYRQKEDAIDKEAIILVAQPFCGERSDDCKSTGYDIT
jgi:hypothetical protein